MKTEEGAVFFLLEENAIHHLVAVWLSLNTQWQGRNSWFCGLIMDSNKMFNKRIFIPKN